MIRVLIAMFACQLAVALAAFTLPVVTPAAAQSIGFKAELVGYYTSLMLVGAMISTMATSKFIHGSGALRVSQASLIFAGLGLAAMPLASMPYTALPVMIVSALLIGFSYGLAIPASSHLLVKVTPSHLTSRVLSIQHAAVPAGGALSGLALPYLEIQLGWEGAVFCAAASCFALALVLQPWRQKLDYGRRGHESAIYGGLGSAIITVLRHPPLRLLAAASGAYAAMQFCFVSLFVTFAIARTGFSLQSVATAMSGGLAVSIGARILWGWAADIFASRLILAGLGLSMAATAFIATTLGPNWPYFALVLLAIGFGSTGTAWQGVYLAEVARKAPEGRVVEATSGCMTATFLGGLVGPGVAAALTITSGNLADGFIFIGAVTLLFGLLFLRKAKHRFD